MYFQKSKLKVNDLFMCRDLFMTLNCTVVGGHIIYGWPTMKMTVLTNSIKININYVLWHVKTINKIN